MTIKKTIQITVTEDELSIIRRSLCMLSMKELCMAQDTIRECEEKGITDNFSFVHMNERDVIRSIIKSIDQANI